MKTALLKTLAIALLLLSVTSPLVAGTDNPAAAAELRTLVGKIQTKIKGKEKVAEADVAPAYAGVF